jgi:hypothetical protein
MTDRVNGGTVVGDFLTGHMNFYTIATIVPVAQTNVTTPVQDLYTTGVYTGTWSNVTVVDGNGVSQSYISQSTYLDAYYKQRNFDTFSKTFAGRANPVAISVTNVTVTGSNTTITAFNSTLFSFSNISALTNQFGSTTTATNVNLIRYATERDSTWLVDYSGTADSNSYGYQLLGTNGLQGVQIFDTVSTQVLPNDVSTTVTTSPFGNYTQYTSNIDATSTTIWNTIAQRKTTLL